MTAERRRFLRALLALAALPVAAQAAGCVRKPPIVYDIDGDGLDRAALRRDGLAVAPVVLVRDLPAPPLPQPAAPGRVEQGLEDAGLPEPTVLDAERDAAFLRNDFVGNIRFGGGFIRTGDVALEVRARILEFGQQQPYAEQGARWLDQAIRGAVMDLGLSPMPADGFVAPAPTRVPFRGVHPDDGHDNVNLPRVDLAPAPLPAEVRGERTPPWVLVPYLRSYYTHNGGWFLGQHYGCMSGARIEVMLVVYDARTGTPAWSMRALGKHLQERRGQASRAELDQYLLWAEDQVELAMAEGLLR